METRVAVMSIIVEDPDSVAQLNGILHEFGEYIIGRMGIPYREKKISLISVALDAPADLIQELKEKLESIPGVAVSLAVSD
jgi:putative iron-only hydrogenase system regulator